jgi:DNA-binding transcriptional regulator of glucitol operon
MDIFWNLVISAGVIWIVLSGISFVQGLHVQNIYTFLQGKGDIVNARDRGWLLTTCYIFAAVDKHGVVADARKLRAMRFVIPSKIQPFAELTGKNLTSLDPASMSVSPRERLALNNLVKRYEKVREQETKKPSTGIPSVSGT